MPRRSRRNPPAGTTTDTTSAAMQTGQRLDHWLWCARLTKTRNEAVRLITSGAVRINRARTEKPATRLRIGDVITLIRHERLYICRVLGFHPRRVSPRDVATLREEL